MEKQKKGTRKDGRPSKRNRGLLSCTECHRRKQKCNRLLPCNDCLLRGVPQKCAYKPPVSNKNALDAGSSNRSSRLKRIINGTEVLLTPESVDALQYLQQAQPNLELSTEEIVEQYNMDQLIESFSHLRADPIFYPTPAQTIATTQRIPGVDPWFLGGTDPFSSIPVINGGPIPTDWLVSHFMRVLAPWLSSYDDSLTPISPRISWFAYSLNHMPLLYATLLSAAVHLDRMKPFGDISKLLWYKAETLRLANERLKTPGEGATDEMILVALILLYFNVTGNNGKEYEIHLRGIHQMLKVRGGAENTGMNGMVKNWIAVCAGPWMDDWTDGQFRT